MAAFNKVVLHGILVTDPELRVTQGNDLPVARTAIAVNRKYKDREEVMFIDIVVFGKLAEVLEAYATKGTPLLIDGRLSQNTWEQEGQKRSKHEIIVENFQLLGSRKDREHDTAANGHFSPTDTGDDDDIPF